MSLFSWFTRKTAPAPARRAQRATVPAPLAPAPTTHSSPEMALRQRNERLERRELLYTVVRDAMVRAGVLSASYKFKVLALDQRGLQFLVMIDLAREYGGETVRLSDIEGLIAQTAKSRHAILVKAVYWRIVDHITAAMAKKGVLPQDTRRTPPPPPLQTAAAVAPVVSPAEPMVAPRFDPIGAEEVAAFKRALASATALRALTTAPASTAPRRSASGDSQFPDTELPEDYAQATRSSNLSHTQYGDL